MEGNCLDFVCICRNTISLPVEGYWELNMQGCVYTHRGKVLLVYFRKWLCGNIRFVPNWHTDWHHFLYPKLGSVPRSGKQQSAFFASRGVYLSWDRRLYWWMLLAGRVCLCNLLILILNISVHALLSSFDLTWLNWQKLTHNLMMQ